MNLSHDAFERVEKWILFHGRPLDAAQYAIHFHGGKVEPFLTLLGLYQNPDGGFGNALEPDSWNPHSTPYATQNAIMLMRDVGMTDASHPLYRGVLRYLESGDSFENGLWLFGVPGNDEHPHAPWWGYNPELNALESLGLSGVLAAFVLDACQPGAPLYEPALSIARQSLDRLISVGAPGVMGMSGCMALRHHWQALGIAPDMDAVDKRLHTLVNASIVRDPAQWEQYVPRPSEVIQSPESPFYKGNEDAINAELDYLISTLPEDDVWPINWCWYDTQERYPKAFAISENWWKAIKAIDKLRLLRAFGRIEGV